MGMNIKADNPAGRLYHILDKSLSQKGKSLSNALYATLNATTFEEYYERHANLRELVRDVRFLVETSERITNKPLYLTQYSVIEEVLCNASPATAWDSEKIKFSDAPMLNLAHIAEALSQEFGEKEISIEELKKLESYMLNLLSEIKVNQLDPTLKRNLSRQLTMMLKAIQEYQIRGAQGIYEAFCYSIGELPINNTSLKNAENAEEVKSYKNLLICVHQAMTNAFAYYQIGQEFLKFLT